jgi:membrane protease YdiL (CAAX protease family)
MSTRGDVDARSARWGVFESLAGLGLAVVLMWLLVRWLTSGVYYDGYLAFILSYAVVWVPLLGACLFACFVTGTRSLRADYGLRVTALDVLFGLGAGLLLRAFASVAEIAFYGRMSGLGVQFGDIVYDGWWVFGTLLAPILLAPFIEELFFRGLVQRTARRVSERVLPAGLAVFVSIVVSAALFAVLHLAESTNATAAAVLGISTFALGLTSALIAALTGRIGGSIIAHMTFNGSLVLAALMA